MRNLAPTVTRQQARDALAALGISSAGVRSFTVGLREITIDGFLTDEDGSPVIRGDSTVDVSVEVPYTT